MKRFILIAVICALGFGQGENPFAKYQENPGFESFTEVHETFRKSVEAQGEDEMNSRLMLAWLHLSEVYRMAEAIDTEIDSLPLGLRFQYANLLLSIGQFDDAIALYDGLNEESPTWSCPWRHKGEACFIKGDYDEAEKAINKAIETRKEHYDAYIWLARVQKAKGEYDQALASIEEGFKYYGEDIEDPETEAPMQDVLLLKLELFKLAGKNDEYDALLKKAKENFPDNPEWDNF